MIDTMFQTGTDAVLDDQLQRPRVAPPPLPSTFAGLATAPFGAIGSGVSKMVAAGAEAAGMFGDVMGAYPEATAAPGTLTDEQRAQGEAARKKLLTQGPSASNEAGDIFRQRAKDLMPDPATTGTAAQLVGGLFEFGTQALGYTLTTGPAAPLMLGLDAAMSESDRLKQQGVDLATRSKAGAVSGLAAGAAIAVPLSGATALARAAKGIAVGEGTMAGQSAAEKAILKAGGYDKLADTFDPLDPVALGIGLVPGALGAKFGHAAPRETARGATPIEAMTLGQRQALPYNSPALDLYAIQAAQREGVPPEILLAVKNAGEKSGPTATSPAGAQGVMQFTPRTYGEFGRGDPMDPMNSIDAGAKYLRRLGDTYGGDWDAAIAHYNGGGAQGAKVRAGEVPSFPETAAYLDRVKAYLGKTADDHVRAAVQGEPDLVPAARVLQTADALDAARLTADDDLGARNAHADAVETASDQLARGDPVDVVGQHFSDEALGAVREPDRVPALASALTAVREAQEPPAARPALARPVETAPEAGAKPARTAPPAAGEEAQPGQASIDRAAAEVSALRPDLMVHLDGMDAPMRVSDLLEQAHAERADTVKDSKLVRIAADCALRG